MIRLNGGLIGARRVLKASSASGIWTPREQSIAQQARIWPPGIIYSNFLTAVNGSTGGAGTFQTGSSNPKNGFDGNISTIVSSANGSYLLFSPPRSIPFDVSLQVIGLESGLESALLNGTTSVTADSAGVARFTGPGVLTTIAIRDRPTSWFTAGFRAIIVDGVLLSDPEFLML